MIYLVSWYIDISADTPQEAAERALEYQRKTDSTAVLFVVTDPSGKETLVDLLKTDDEEKGLS